MLSPHSHLDTILKMIFREFGVLLGSGKLKALLTQLLLRQIEYLYSTYSQFLLGFSVLLKLYFLSDIQLLP